MLATASTQEKLGRSFGKNAGEWTGRVEISKEEIPGSKRSMHGNIPTYSRLKLCVLIRWDFISASEAPHCGSIEQRRKCGKLILYAGTHLITLGTFRWLQTNAESAVSSMGIIKDMLGHV